MRHSIASDSDISYPYKELIDIVNLSVMQVDNVLGPGLDIEAYKKAIKIEFDLHQVLLSENSIAEIYYKGQFVSKKVAHFILQRNGYKLAVNISNQSEISDPAILEMQAFLRYSNYQAGIIINIGGFKPEVELVVV